jgi:hypothetical protein
MTEVPDDGENRMYTFSEFASVFQSSPNQPVQFFTIETLFSAAGATTAVITVTTVLHGFFPKLPARWFALGFSLFLTIVGIGVQHQSYDAPSLLLAIINALVIYSAAVGVNNIATSLRYATTPPVDLSARNNRWWP